MSFGFEVNNRSGSVSIYNIIINMHIIKDLPWPDVNSYAGFFVYSFLTYLFVLFAGWLVNPTIEEAIKTGTE